jgi:hypothetical protein
MVRGMVAGYMPHRGGGAKGPILAQRNLAADLAHR